MKRILAFLAKPFVLGVIGLIALSLLIWFGCGYIHIGSSPEPISPTVRLTLILICVLVWLLNIIRKLILDKKKDANLFEGISKSEPAPQSGNSDADKKAKHEAELLKARFADAVKVLSKSGFSKLLSGGKSIYQLPWYIIIGPPGAGKTTALINSGLRFPLAKADNNSPLEGIGGTRNCDWWFTDEAVMIDTAGRYTTQDSRREVDNSAWSSFLKLLKKHRKRQPINGALVAISVSDLITQSAQGRETLAKTIRSRIEELHAELGINFPIYLLVTKCDLLPGFNDFFQNYTRAEREQVWGITYDLDTDPRTLVDTFKTGFQKLIASLDARLLQHIQRERDAGKREQMVSLPLQMRQLSDILSDFQQVAFAHNRYQSQPMIRGVYFTSGTQEGTPIDRMMGALSRNMGLVEEARSDYKPIAGKSFFIYSLLKDIVFPESSIVGTDRKVEKLMRAVRLTAYTAIALFFVGTLFVWTGSIAQNKIYLDQVEASVDSFKSIRDKAGSRITDADTLTKLLGTAKDASEVYNQENHPWISSIGLYDSSVDNAADKLYQASLSTYLLPVFKHSVERHLTSSRSDQELYDSLRTYQMLANPERREAAAITNWGESYWLKVNASAADAQLAIHLKNMVGFPFRAASQNRQILASAQREMAGKPPAQRAFILMQTHYRDYPGLSLSNDAGDDTLKFFGLSRRDSITTIPYLFTKKAYKEIDTSAESPFITQLAQENWILGDQAQKAIDDNEREVVAKNLKHVYLTNYEKAWSSLLRSLHVANAPFASWAGLSRTLDNVSDPVYSPLANLLRVVRENTELNPMPHLDNDKLNSAAGSVASQFVKPNLVDKEFEPINQLFFESKKQPKKLDEYLTAMKTLDTQVNDLSLAPSSTKAAYAFAKKRFDGESADALSSILRLSVSRDTPEPVNLWLKEIADKTWGLILAQSAAYLNQTWQDESCNYFSTYLASRYPFAKGSGNDATIDQFSRYFSPAGIENTFFKNYLKPFIDTRSWETIRKDGRVLPVSGEFISQLSIAEGIRSGLYAADPSKATVTFRLKPLKMDADLRRFELNLGSRQYTFSYTHGPQITRHAQWIPGGSDRLRTIFENRAGDIKANSFTGDWALYRLLESARISAARAPNTYYVTFTHNGKKVEYELRLDRSTTPIMPKMLQKYRCVEMM